MLTSFDRLLKSDLQVAEAIATIKYYITDTSANTATATNMNNTTTTNPIPSDNTMIISELNYYLSAFCKIVNILFTKLQTAANFQSKFIANALKAMEIPAYIHELHKKFTATSQEPNKPPTSPTHHSLKICTFYNLLRLLLLADVEPDTWSLSMRIVFYLFEDIMREQRQALPDMKGKKGTI